jgi:hypothetical protein
MGRTANPFRDRAVHLMRAGLATAEEIARAMEIPATTVQSWRRRARIWTMDARDVHVRRLMMKGQPDGQSDADNDGPAPHERRADEIPDPL